MVITRPLADVVARLGISLAGLVAKLLLVGVVNFLERNVNPATYLANHALAAGTLVLGLVTLTALRRGARHLLAPSSLW